MDLPRTAGVVVVGGGVVGCSIAYHLARRGQRDVLVLGDDVIHAVSNTERKFTGAVHVYGGNFFTQPRSEWDPETLEERAFDVESARKVFADANERFLGTLGDT